MMRSLFSGVAGLRTHQTKMDVIGNNIANVNTTGYKSQSVTFRDLMLPRQHSRHPEPMRRPEPAVSMQGRLVLVLLPGQSIQLLHSKVPRRRRTTRLIL